MGKAKRNILPFFIPHQGCPNQCIFCNQHRITGVGDTIDFAHIEKEILRLVPAGETEIAFYGGSFSGLPLETQRRLLLPAFRRKEMGDVSHIRISTRPDYIDEERLSFLGQYGVDIIEIGAQSLSDEVLAKARRGHSREDTLRAVKLIKDFGFQLIIQLLPGLPGDGYEQAVAGAREAAALEPDGVRIYPAVVLKDTPLGDMYEKGEYGALSVEEAVTWCRDMAVFFLRKEIAIIRIGLQPTEDISWNGAVSAGAFHPAFGQLVQSALALEQCKMLLENASEKMRCIAVPKKQLSTYIGQKRTNLLWLWDTYGQEMQIIPDATLGDWEIGLQEEKDGCLLRRFSWQDFLEKYAKKVEEKIVSRA